MAASGKKWLTGCTIGCVALLVILGLVTMAGFMMISGTLEGFREAKETGEELAGTHGAIVDFTPPHPGELPAVRLHLFISVRESLAGPQKALEAAFIQFPAAVEKAEKNEESTWRTIFTVFRGLGDLIRPMGEYVEARNRALLDAGMGQGEYLFYYGLVYYSWLGHSPDDIPRMDGGDQDGSNTRIHAGQNASFSAKQSWRRYRFYTEAMLRNLHAAMTASADPEAGTALQDLTAEIDRLAKDPDHFVWSDGLPPAWQTALEPERERLAKTYNKTANIFEWPTGAGEGDGSITFTLD
ncbi:MAG: hypothetical protein O7A07_02060 [Acidobacteria bacterium]|nr:hypothetical protein [Acidobacteriota bacterium]